MPSQGRSLPFGLGLSGAASGSHTVVWHAGLMHSRLASSRSLFDSAATGRHCSDGPGINLACTKEVCEATVDAMVHLHTYSLTSHRLHVTKKASQHPVCTRTRSGRQFLSGMMLFPRRMVCIKLLPLGGVKIFRKHDHLPLK